MHHYLHAHATRINAGDDLLAEAVRSVVRQGQTLGQTLGQAAPASFADFASQTAPWEDCAGAKLSAALLESPEGRRLVAVTLSECRALIIGAGDLITNAPQYALLARAAEILRRPTVLLGIGVNLHRCPPAVVALWRQVLPGVAAAWARDDDSATRLVELGLPADRVRTLPDLAYLSTESTESTDRATTGRERIGLVSLRTPEGNSARWGVAFYAALGAALDETAERESIRWRFLPMVGAWQRALGHPRDDDARAFDALAPHVHSGLDSAPMDRRITVDELSDELRRARVAVAMRLHVGILASMVGTPVVPIAYSPKVSAWAHSSGLSAWTLQPTEDDVARLPACVTRAWAPGEGARLLDLARLRAAELRGAASEAAGWKDARELSPITASAVERAARALELPRDWRGSIGRVFDRGLGRVRGWAGV